jgi:hypothetical protein
MTDNTELYVERAPGNLLTAEDWNTMQRKIHGDIRATSQAAADAVTHVASADDSSHLEGKDIDDLTAEVTKRVLDEIRGRTGYQQLFKILKAGEVTELKHDLGTAPLVDVYKLEYFEVACREDEDTHPAFATFYLSHSDERRVRVTDEGGKRLTIDIQPKDFPEVGIPFADMLTRYNVQYKDTTSLADLEVEFYKVFFSAPNDQFGDDQYCHSPWFERCCKEDQSVKEIKEKGDWDDIIFHVRPRKSINFEATGVEDELTFPRPSKVFVQHLDNNRTAIWFEGLAVHDGGDETRAREYIGEDEFDHELKVMVLLKV